MSSFSQIAALSLSATMGLSTACAPARSGRAPASEATITSQDLQNPNEPIESVLQRKTPGLLVVRTASGIALQIRGSSSFRGGTTPPLFMLNGLPYQPGPDGALTGIDPHDIETITVLKGPDAAIYGMQGANGVIVITTKKRLDTEH